jgi:hypothetical protein
MPHKNDILPHELYAREATSAPIVDVHGFERFGHMTHFGRDLR